MDSNFLTACALGDGCLSKDKRWGTVTLHIQRCARQSAYAEWQLEKLNAVLGTKATLKELLDKGKYPAVRFGVSSKAKLGPVYDALYPSGVKVFSSSVLRNLGPAELAIFFMDDGSLEVRRRERPRSVKIERTAWLACSHEETETKAIAEWIHAVAGATPSITRHKTGMLYLRWHSRQAKNLVEVIRPFVLPCLGYKVDMTRESTVADWLETHKKNGLS